MQTARQTDQPIFIADPQILSIPVQDNGESFIDLRDHPEIVYGPSPEIPNNTCYTKLRKTVFEKLKEAQALLPKGLRFCLYEGYRSLSLQQQLFEQRYNCVKSLHSSWPHEEIFIETTRLVSPVVNLDGSKNIPPHSTGGAFDIYLIDAQGVPPDMGLHPKDWMHDQDGTVSVPDSKYISAQARANRRIMSNALESVGFINYLHEYWHWSYGDRYWAYRTNQPYAIYGPL